MSAFTYSFVPPSGSSSSAASSSSPHSFSSAAAFSSSYHGSSSYHQHRSSSSSAASVSPAQLQFTGMVAAPVSRPPGLHQPTKTAASSSSSLSSSFSAASASSFEPNPDNKFYRFLSLPNLSMPVPDLDAIDPHLPDVNNNRAMAGTELVGLSRDGGALGTADDRTLTAAMMAGRTTVLQNPLTADNRGYQMLSKMGYSKGRGLGKNETGIAEPIKPHFNPGRSGLGHTLTNKDAVRRSDPSLLPDAYRYKPGALKKPSLRFKNNTHNTNSKRPPPHPFFCSLCEITSKDHLQYKQHLSSQEHSNQMEQRIIRDRLKMQHQSAQQQRAGQGGQTTTTTKATASKRKLTGIDNSSSHDSHDNSDSDRGSESGTNDLALSHKPKRTKKGRPRPAAAAGLALRCDLCHVLFHSADAATQHEQTDSHRSKAEKKRRKTKGTSLKKRTNKPIGDGDEVDRAGESNPRKKRRQCTDGTHSTKHNKSSNGSARHKQHDDGA